MQSQECVNHTSEKIKADILRCEFAADLLRYSFKNLYQEATVKLSLLKVF